MAQDPNDPNVQAYYRKQRLDAEAKALGGDASAAPELQKIGAKLQRGGNARQRSIGTTDKEIAGGPKANAAQDKTNDFLGAVASTFAVPGGIEGKMAAKGLGPVGPEIGRAMGPVGAFLGSAAKAAMKAAKGMGKGAEDLIEHPAAAEEMARHVGRQVARRIFPDADEAVEGTARAQRRSLQAARVSPGKPKAIGKDAGRTMTGKTNSPGAAKRAAAEDTARSRMSQPKGIKKTVNGKTGTDYRAPKLTSSGPRKALPAPDPARSMRGKQMPNVKAGTPRAKQAAPRDMGTNPRAQAGYVRGGVKKGYAKGEKAENDPTNAPKAKKKAKAAS